jgi:hypothetical protein
MNMSQEHQWLPKAQVRYARRNREGKSRMLDELCEDYHYERKYAMKLFSGTLAAPNGRPRPGPERRYELIEPVVRKVWLTAQQPCGHGPQTAWWVYPCRPSISRLSRIHLRFRVAPVVPTTLKQKNKRQDPHIRPRVP